MSDPIAAWNTEYENHQVWTFLEQALQFLQGRQPDKEQELKYETLSLILHGAVEYREHPSIWVSLPLLNDLEESVRSVREPLTNWQQQGEAAHLDQAYSNLGGLIASLRGWPPIQQTFARNIQNSLNSLAARAKQATTDYEQVHQQLKDEIASGRQTLTELVQSLEQRSNASVEKIEAEAERISELLAGYEQSATDSKAQVDSAVQGVNSRLDPIVTDFQQKFLDAQTDRQTKFDEATRLRAAEFQAWVGDSKDELARSQESFNADAEATLARIEELRSQAAGVVSLISVSSTADWYGKHAKFQRWTAEIVRFFAVLAFAAAAAFGVWWVMHYDTAELSVTQVIAKSLLTAGLAGLGVYLARESAIHREEEFLAKETELKLRAFDPFVANLSEDKQLVLKEETARAIFVGFARPPLSKP